MSLNSLPSAKSWAISLCLSAQRGFPLISNFQVLSFEFWVFISDFVFAYDFGSRFQTSCSIALLLEVGSGSDLELVALIASDL